MKRHFLSCTILIASLFIGKHQAFAVCDTLNKTPFGSLSLVSLQNPQSGYMAGQNSTQPKSVAQKFENFGGLSHLTGTRIYFGHVKDGGNNAWVHFRVWDNTGSGGLPGNVLSSVSIPLADLDFNIPNGAYPSGGGFFQVIFPSVVAVTSTYYIGISMQGFGIGDSLGILSNSPGNTVSNYAFVQNQGNTWQSFTSAYSISTLSLYISAYMTNVPVKAKISANPTELCQGQSAFFSGTASLNANTYAWQFQGGLPSLSNNITEIISYNLPGTYKTFLSVSGNCQAQHIDSVTVVVKDKPQLVLSALQHVSCNAANNGFVGVEASGAGGNYTYVWNTIPVQNTDTAFNLSGGTYTVIVTGANGCSSQFTQTVNEPSAITIAFTSTPASCTPGNDGTATALPSGGVPGYSYNWNTFPTQTTQTAVNLGGNATYSLIVTDQTGCAKQDSVFVPNVGNLLSLSFTTTPTNCNGGSDGTATVNVSGGGGSYTYLWNTNPIQTTQTAINLSAGSYSVTVTDVNSGCTKIGVVTISQPTAIQLAPSSTPVSCAGYTDGSASVTPSGGTSPYTYSWNSIPVQTTQTAINLPGGTYTVTVTDANGCVAFVNATVNQPAPVSAFIVSSINPQCAMGSFNGQAVAGATGGTGTYSYLWNTIPVQTNDTAFNVGPGTWKVYVTDQNGCTDSATVTLTAPGNQPNVTIVNQTNNTCFGGNSGTATTTASGGTPPYSYVWNTIPPQFGGVAVNMPAGTFMVTLTDVNGCQDTAYVTITQGPEITATFNTTLESCGAGDATATVFPAGGYPPYVGYLWNPGGQTTQTATNLSQGIYTVTITDNQGCTANHSVNVWNSSGTITTIKQFTQPLCNGDSTGTATINPSGGTPGYTYLWNTNPVQTTQTAVNLPAGTFVVVTTDNSGCSKTDTIVVTQPTPLSLNPNFANKICATNNGMAVVEPTGGAGSYTYLWSPGGQTTNGIYNLPAGLYKVVVTDANGCQDSVVITVSQINNTITSNVFIIDTVTCFGGNDGSAYAIANSGTAPFSYTWNTVPSQNNDTAFNMPAGTFTVTILDAFGCVGTNTVQINQPPAIQLFTNSINNTDSMNCNGSVAVQASGGTPGYTYLWSPGGQTGTTISNLCAGTYCVTVTDANGCTANICTTIQGPSPCNLSVSVNATNPSCFGSSNGSATATTSGGTPPFTFVWQDLNGNSVNNTALSAGFYTVLVTDSAGCSDVETFFLFDPQAMQADVFVTHNVCFGGTSGTATLANLGGGLPPYTISPVSPQLNLAAGTYTFTVTDSLGCQLAFPYTILQGQEIVITTQANSATCTLADGEAIASASGGASPYTFVWNDANATENDTLKGVKAGTYVVTVTDSNNCVNTASVSILSTDNIQSVTETTPESCPGFFDGTATVKVISGIGPYMYLWSNGIPEQTTGELKAGAHTVTIRDNRGCVWRDTAIVELANKGCLNIPNAFTPNGDGTNDIWRIRGYEAYPNMQVEVFNRWGSIIFSSGNGYTIPWDGRHNGKDVAPGVYYYVVNPGDGSETLTGSVTVIR